MQSNIQYTQTKVNKNAENLVLVKLDKLSKKYGWVTYADIFFKTEKGTYGKGKICEILLSAPGPRLYAASEEESFEIAVAETIQDLKKQLKKRNEFMKRKR